MAEIKAKLAAIYRDKHWQTVGLAYNTTIPTSVPIGTAQQIIDGIVAQYFARMEMVNNSLQYYGELTGVTENILQDCYSFTIGKGARSEPEEITYIYEERSDT